MPIYEYRCQRCDNVFEKKMPMKEKSKTRIVCPECSSEDVEQQLFGVNFSGRKTGDGKFSGGCCGEGNDCCG